MHETYRDMLIAIKFARCCSKNGRKTPDPTRSQQHRARLTAREWEKSGRARDRHWYEASQTYTSGAFFISGAAIEPPLKLNPVSRRGVIRIRTGGRAGQGCSNQREFALFARRENDDRTDGSTIVQMARRVPAGSHCFQSRYLALATIHDERTTRVKVAAGRRLQRRRDLAADWLKLRAPTFKSRHLP